VYHTPNDILDNVSPKATKDTLEIFIKYITNLDQS
jgi:hypothetical protein